MNAQTRASSWLLGAGLALASGALAAQSVAAIKINKECNITLDPKSDSNYGRVDILKLKDKSLIKTIKPGETGKVTEKEFLMSFHADEELSAYSVAYGNFALAVHFTQAGVSGAAPALDATLKPAQSVAFTMTADWAPDSRTTRKGTKFTPSSNKAVYNDNKSKPNWLLDIEF